MRKMVIADWSVYATQNKSWTKKVKLDNIQEMKRTPSVRHQKLKLDQVGLIEPHQLYIVKPKNVEIIDVEYKS